MNPFTLPCKLFKAALRWLVGVEDRDILTPFERSLFGKGNRVDDVAKLLDNGWTIQLFRNALGSYTARAVPSGILCKESGYLAVGIDTDDFTVSKALYRLTEKVTTGRLVGPQDTEEP